MLSYVPAVYAHIWVTDRACFRLKLHNELGFIDQPSTWFFTHACQSKRLYCTCLCCILSPLQAQKAADEVKARAQMEAAIGGGGGGASWGLLGPEAEWEEGQEPGSGQGLDWRAYIEKHSLTDKQNKVLDKIRCGGRGGYEGRGGGDSEGRGSGKQGAGAGLAGLFWGAQPD